MAAINMAYDMSRASAKDYFEEMNDTSTDDLFPRLMKQPICSMKPVTRRLLKLVNLLVAGAIKDRASDIHVEPYSSTSKSAIVLTAFYMIF